MPRSEEGSFFNNLFGQRSKLVIAAERREAEALQSDVFKEEALNRRLRRKEKKVIRSFGVSQENLEQVGFSLLPHTLLINFGKKTMKFLLVTPMNEKLEEIFVLNKSNKKNPGLNKSEFVSVEYENEIIRREGRTETIYSNEFNRHFFVDTLDALTGYKTIDIPPSCTSRHYYNVSIGMNDSVIKGRIELKDQLQEISGSLRKESIIGAEGTVVGMDGKDKDPMVAFLLDGLKEDDIIIAIQGISTTSDFTDFELGYGDALSRVANDII